MLTVKSDDFVGRNKMYEHIIKSEFPDNPGVPESFKVLVKELQALALDVELLKNDRQKEGKEEKEEKEKVKEKASAKGKNK